MGKREKGQKKASWIKKAHLFPDFNSKREKAHVYSPRIMTATVGPIRAPVHLFQGPCHGTLGFLSKGKSYVDVVSRDTRVS